MAAPDTVCRFLPCSVLQGIRQGFEIGRIGPLKRPAPDQAPLIHTGDTRGMHPENRGDSDRLQGRTPVCCTTGVFDPLRCDIYAGVLLTCTHYRPGRGLTPRPMLRHIEDIQACALCTLLWPKHDALLPRWRKVLGYPATGTWPGFLCAPTTPMGFPVHKFGAWGLCPHGYIRDCGTRFPIWDLGLLLPRSRRSYLQDVSEVCRSHRWMHRGLIFGALLVQGHLMRPGI